MLGNIYFVVPEFCALRRLDRTIRCLKLKRSIFGFDWIGPNRSNHMTLAVRDHDYLSHGYEAPPPESVKLVGVFTSFLTQK